MFATVETEQNFRATIARFMAVGFAALLGVLVSTGVLIAIGQQQTRWIMHIYEVEREIAAIRLTATELIGVRLSNRLHAPPHDSRHAIALNADHPGADQVSAQVIALQATLENSIAQLARSTMDNPRQQARIPLLMAGATKVEHEAGLDVPVEARAGMMSDDPAQLFAAVCTVMLDEETGLLEFRNQRRTELGRDIFLILALTGVLLLIVATLTYTTITSYTRELAGSRQALHAANTGLEAAVQDRTSELVRANAEIQRFVYIVSHDLRSPLINILGFTAEMDTATRQLQDELHTVFADRPPAAAPSALALLTEEMPEAIDFIRASAQKMDRLINAILQLSRLGRRALAPEWLDLEALVGDVTSTLQLLISQAGATVAIAQPMPALHCDRVALEQILANLVENAIKYRQVGRALQIRIAAERVGDRVIIAVADNGRGIDARDSERVFDLFRRAGPQDQPGEGIGLAHVRALAYRLNGSISLDSALGTGSTFTLTLPVHFDDVEGLPT
jgi:signal transduction histidine kinase